MRAPRFDVDRFPTEADDLPTADSPEWVTLADGDRFDLRIAPVTKRVGDRMVRMLASNGSIPGPILRVQQGSEVLVDVVNGGDLEATVHWHGLRLDNRYDGTLATQRPIPVGGRFTYHLTFPDPGVYWYHPHIREDYGQEMGLYGNIVVVPSEPSYWPRAHREIALTVDDILLEDGKIAPFHRQHPTYTAMGRFGNVLLINGETQPSFMARRGEIVRLYLTNTANTRVFNVGLPGARMKLVGGDSGRYEREAFVDSVVIAPSERVVLDVLFDRGGRGHDRASDSQPHVHARHRHRWRRARAAAPGVPVRESPQRCRALGGPNASRRFPRRRTRPDPRSRRRDGSGRTRATRGRRRGVHLSDALRRGPGRAGEVPALRHEVDGHCGCTARLRLPDASRGEEPARRPLPEVRHEAGAGATGCRRHPGPTADPHGAASSHQHHHGHAAEHDHAAAAGIEWEDDMVEVNRMTNPTNMRWKLIDRHTGAEGASIDWRFRVGERVKIRVVNEMDSDHPMHHPFHIHGAGRFVILSRDGVAETNLVWKDTVLVRTGETVDLLLDVTHPGTWMAHCHIAEHHESGMMLTFRVDN